MGKQSHTFLSGRLLPGRRTFPQTRQGGNQAEEDEAAGGHAQGYPEVAGGVYQVAGSLLLVREKPMTCQMLPTIPERLHGVHSEEPVCGLVSASAC